MRRKSDGFSPNPRNTISMCWSDKPGFNRRLWKCIVQGARQHKVLSVTAVFLVRRKKITHLVDDIHGCDISNGNENEFVKVAALMNSSANDHIKSFKRISVFRF